MVAKLMLCLYLVTGAVGLLVVMSETLSAYPQFYPVFWITGYGLFWLISWRVTPRKWWV